MQDFSLRTLEVKGTVDDIKNKNKNSVEEFLNQILQSRPFGNRKFYVLTFLKNTPGDPHTKKLVYQPRLTKPKPNPNTSLYRLNPLRPDEVEVFWILPKIQAFGLYAKGKVHENEFIHECIQKYLNEYDSLCRKEADDISDSEIKELYRCIHRYGSC